MVSRIRRHVGGNAVAYVALFVALGGSSYAATRVTGAAVEDGSLTGADIRAHSITSRNIALPARSASLTAQSAASRRGRRGPRGFRGYRGYRGYTGPIGPAGLAGAQGAPGVSGVQIVMASSGTDSGAGKSASALCPVGKRAIGGGADIDGTLETGASESNPAVYLTDSQPVTNGAQSGWQGVGREEAPGYDTNWRIDAYAVCAVVS